MKGSYCIRILGRELQVRSSASPESVQEIEAFVNQTVERVASRVKGGDTLSVAILSLMTMAEEHLALSRRMERSAGETGQVAQLIRTIDEVLPETAD